MHVYVCVCWMLWSWSNSCGSHLMWVLENKLQSWVISPIKTICTLFPDNCIYVYSVSWSYLFPNLPPPLFQHPQHITCPRLPSWVLIILFYLFTFFCDLLGPIKAASWKVDGSCCLDVVQVTIASVSSWASAVPVSGQEGSRSQHSNSDSSSRS